MLIKTPKPTIQQNKIVKPTVAANPKIENKK